MSYYKNPQFMSRKQLGEYFGMSRTQITEAIYQSLADGESISVIRPNSAKGKGHPRYKVSDILRAWKYEHPLALPELSSVEQ